METVKVIFETDAGRHTICFGDSNGTTWRDRFAEFCRVYPHERILCGFKSPAAWPRLAAAWLDEDAVQTALALECYHIDDYPNPFPRRYADFVWRPLRTDQLIRATGIDSFDPQEPVNASTATDTENTAL